MNEHGCGTVGHDDDCLCDVHIEQPTAVRTGLVDNWVLAMVADYMDLSWPWDASKFGLLLQNSSKFLDAFHGDNDKVVIRYNEKGNLLESTVLQVPRMYAKYKCDTVTETLHRIGLDYDTFLLVMSRGQKTRDDIPLEKLECLVADLREGNTSGRRLHQRYDIIVVQGLGKFLRDLYLPETSPHYPHKKRNTDETI